MSGLRGTFRTALRRAWDIRLHGLDGLPATGPVILAANHIGTLDGPLLVASTPRTLALAKSELFTEGFLVPITAVAAKEASFGQLMKLWGGTLVMNLAGGWLFMLMVVQAFPQWKPELADAALHFVEAGFTWQSICLAVLAGSTITLMTRMQQGTDSDTAKIVAAMAGGFLLAGLQLFHSILDSLLIFGAIHAGVAVSYADWFGWFGYTLLFNMLGGLLLVTALRLLRNKDLIAERRRAAPEDPDAAR